MGYFMGRLVFEGSRNAIVLLLMMLGYIIAAAIILTVMSVVVPIKIGIYFYQKRSLNHANGQN